MIERYLLRYFLAVADQRSFSKAADQCCVTQPTLSIGIAKLEDLLGKQLLVRSNRQVRLTSAGSRLLQHARKIESEFNLARSAVEADGGAAAVRLGVLNSIPGIELAKIVRLASSRCKGETYEIVPGNARELTGKLGKGRIDAALSVISGEDARFNEVPLRTESFRVALPADHALAGRTFIAAEDLANDVMIVRRHCEALPQISRHFAERGIQPHFAFRATNDERVLQMIASGLGITVMPECYAAEGVRLVPLAGFGLQRTLGLLREGGSGRPGGIIDAATEVIATGARPVTDRRDGSSPPAGEVASGS